MASYIVGVVSKQNLATYAKYAQAGFESLAGFDVEVVATDQLEVMEGSFPGSSIIILKFKDDGAAQRWYESDAYQAALPLRRSSASTAFMVHFTAQ
jgi:uncharacterized protein (DUF1330 family)